MLALGGVFRLIRPDEPRVNAFLAEVNVFFLGQTCGFCLCGACTGFPFLFNVLEFEDNWLAALLISIGRAGA